VLFAIPLTKSGIFPFDPKEMHKKTPEIEKNQLTDAERNVILSFDVPNETAGRLKFARKVKNSMLFLICQDLPRGASCAETLQRNGIPAIVVSPEAAETLKKRWDYGGIFIESADAPLSSEHPEELLRFCLEHGYSTHAETYALQADAITLQVIYLGYPLPLTPSEARVLIHLFRRAPAVASADEISSVCFPRQGITLSRLTNLASSINRKAKAISGLCLIRSARGKGYRLAEGILRAISGEPSLEPPFSEEEMTVTSNQLRFYAEKAPF